LGMHLIEGQDREKAGSTHHQSLERPARTLLTQCPSSRRRQASRGSTHNCAKASV